MRKIYATLEEAKLAKQARGRRERASNPDKIREDNRKYARQHPERVLLSNAKSRKVECNIDLSDIVIPEFCPVLGIKLDSTAPARADNKPSLDRIDPAKGYVKGNVWVISWKANHLKTNNTLETLHALTRALERLY